MRVLFIGNFLNPSWDGSLPDEEHIAKSLEKFGHEVVRLQREDNKLPYPSGEYDFILIAQWYGYPAPMVPELRSGNYCPIVYWAFDLQNTGEDWHLRLVEQSDVYLSKALSDSKYKNWQWLPQDFAPTFLNTDWDNRPEKDIDILFTGSYLPWATDRIETLRAIDKMYDLQIYSFTPQAWIDEGFKHVDLPVMDEGLKDLIPRAKINLSIDHTITPGYWSDRNAQIMALGGAVLFRHVPMSEIVFRDAIQYFYNIDDCLQQIEWLLSQDLTAFEMYAWNFAQQNLMVDSRVNDLLTIVKAYI